MAETGRWYYCFRCVLLHAEGSLCPKAEVEEGASEGGASSAPAILGRTREDSIRPDENDFAKEMRLSARIMEEDGGLDPATRKMFERNIAAYKDMPGSRFWKDREIPFAIPRQFKKKKYFSGGL